MTEPTPDNTPVDSTPVDSQPLDNHALDNPLPDRLSLDPRSPYHDADLLTRGIGIHFNGSERTNVEEYCISEGWIRVVVGKALDRRGQPMTMKINGKVEPYLQDDALDAQPVAD